MTTQAVLVDDDPEDLKYAQRLTRGNLNCVPLFPPDTAEELRQEISRLVRRHECDIVLLDYRLDTEGGSRRYRGGTVAAQLKEYLPNLPVVLVTTEQKLRDSLREKPRVRRLFDYLLLKSRLAKQAERGSVVNELTGLAEGFSVIVSSRGTGWRRVVRLLDAQEDEAIEIEALDIPEAPAGTTEIAQWILHDLLPYPGLLLDGYQAAALLGITHDTFLREEVQRLVAPTRYAGVFSDWQERWWRGRLQRCLTSAAGNQPGVGGADRSKAIAGATGKTRRIIRRAKCVWCSGPNVAYACTRCREPVDAQHALAAVVDDRPHWADSAMVCFKCISTGRAQDVKFRPGAEPIVRGLERGEITPEASDGR